LRDEGKTIFLTTHYMEEAETLADIVAIIIDGNIRAMDTTNNLVKNYRHQAKLIIHGAGKDAFAVLSTRWFGTVEDKDRVIVPLEHKNDLNKITALLDERQIKYEDIEMKKPTLEDVFLDLTSANQEAQLEA
jgi:ABC-2 type transport system ATP-binding protein